MVKSMTGYGCARGQSGDIGVVIELRSVNNRYLDCNIRIPRVYTAVEDPMKALVQRYITRGKVDVYVNLDTSQADNVTVEVNRTVADSYMRALEQLSQIYGIENDITAVSLSRLQDVLRIEKTEADTDALARDLCAVLEQALRGFDEMRSCEGEKLYADISSHLDEIERLTNMAEERSPATVAAYREKLAAKMLEILESRDIDENRILLEAAIFADRVAVNEEIVRLRSHVSQLRTMLLQNEPVGRKLDFLIQELNREANTLGSKGNDGEMARIVIDLKAEIEKIREQVQNIE